MRLALPNASGPLFFLEDTLLEEGIAASRESPRRRMIYPIHRNQGDLVQRMLNFFQPGTYVTPHLHPRESASELILVLRGKLGFVLFDDEGEITERRPLVEGDLIDIEPKLWHGMVVLEEDTVILEIKRGPYDDEDKIFAPWAPSEGDSGAEAYRLGIERLFIDP